MMKAKRGAAPADTDDLGNKNSKKQRGTRGPLQPINNVAPVIIKGLQLHTQNNSEADSCVYPSMAEKLNKFVRDYYTNGYYHAKGLNPDADQVVSTLFDNQKTYVLFGGCELEKTTFSPFSLLRQMDDPLSLFALCWCHSDGCSGGPLYDEKPFRGGKFTHFFPSLKAIAAYVKLVCEVFRADLRIESVSRENAADTEEQVAVLIPYFDLLWDHLSPYLEDLMAGLFQFVQGYRCKSFLEKEKRIPKNTTLREWCQARAGESIAKINGVLEEVQKIYGRVSPEDWRHIYGISQVWYSDIYEPEKVRLGLKTMKAVSCGPRDAEITPPPTCEESFKKFRQVFIRMMEAKRFPPAIHDLFRHDGTQREDTLGLLIDYSAVSDCNPLIISFHGDNEMYNTYVPQKDRKDTGNKKVARANKMAARNGVTLEEIEIGFYRPNQGSNKKCERLHRFKDDLKDPKIERGKTYIGCPFCVHCRLVPDDVAKKLPRYEGHELQSKMMVNGATLVKFEEKPSHELRQHHCWKKIYNHIRDEHLWKEVSLIDEPGNKGFILNKMTQMPVLFQLEPNEYHHEAMKSEEQLRQEYDEYKARIKGEEERYMKRQEKNGKTGEDKTKTFELKKFEDFKKDHEKKCNWQLKKVVQGVDHGSLNIRYHEALAKIETLKNELYNTQVFLEDERSKNRALRSEIAELKKGR